MVDLEEDSLRAHHLANFEGLDNYPCILSLNRNNMSLLAQIEKLASRACLDYRKGH